jgi:ribonuclease P protein component
MKFGPQRRIRKRPEFQALQAQGRRAVSPHFVFIIAAAPVVDALPRLGITVTKRVGNAVRRSRIKRIVRAAFQQENGLVPRGYDLVVIARKDDPQLRPTDVVAEFRNCARRLLRSQATPSGLAAPPS